jgi:hypothetical protein
VARDDKPQEDREFLYSRCPTCGVKIHISARYCWKCGGRYNVDENTGKPGSTAVHPSKSESDYLCCAPLNDVDRCFICRTAQTGHPCPPARCFGTGRGRCESCARHASVRYACCQEVIEKEPPPWLDEKKFFENLREKWARGGRQS